jgi:hypothetical protein
MRYVDGKPHSIDTVVLSTQHSPDISLEDLREAAIEQIIKPVLPKELIKGDIKYLVNPTGRFVVGGPQGDCGLTGRKIIVDTYGGAAPHGGGAFSGKDPSKVDRSAAYATRYVAKNIVAAGLASRCLAGVVRHRRGRADLDHGRDLRHRRSAMKRSPRWFASTSTCVPRASSICSTCSVRSTRRPPPTAISAATSRNSAGKQPIAHLLKPTLVCKQHFSQKGGFGPLFVKLPNMLKKYPSSTALGMHLGLSAALGWIIRSGAQVRSDRPQRLALILGSPIKEVWIDVSKGLDADPGESDAAASHHSESVPPPPPVPERTGSTTRSNALPRSAPRARKQSFPCSGSAHGQGHRRRSGGTAGRRNIQLGDAQPGCLISLARLKTADDYTFMHSVAVCALMIALPATRARRAQVRDAGMAGLLHDLGKAMIPLEMLNKPGKLTDEEFDLVKTHPEGYKLLLEGSGISEVPRTSACITTKRSMVAAIRKA